MKKATSSAIMEEFKNLENGGRVNVSFRGRKTSISISIGLKVKTNGLSILKKEDGTVVIKPLQMFIKKKMEINAFEGALTKATIKGQFYIHQKGSPSWIFKTKSSRDRYFQAIESIMSLMKEELD